MILWRRRLSQALLLRSSVGWYTLLWRVLQAVRRRLPVDRLFHGWALPPDMISLNITSRCNLRCSYCCGAKDTGHHLPLSSIQRLLDEVRWFRPTILLSGGEPFLRIDLPAIVREIKARKLILTINTNGTIWTPELLRSLIDARVDSVTVSLDAWALRHDQLRGVPGTFEKVIGFLRTLHALKQETGSRLPLVRTNTVVSNANVAEIEDIYDSFLRGGLAELVDYMQFQLMAFVPQERLDSCPYILGQPVRVFGQILPATESFGNANLLWKFRERIRSNRKACLIPETPTSSIDWDAVYFSRHPIPGTFCTAPYFKCVISSDGDVGLCIPGGNLLRSPGVSFLSCWNAPVIRQFRWTLSKLGTFPVCLRCCMAGYHRVEKERPRYVRPV